MARHKLENELIAIEVEEHGAELKSLVRKNTGKEYMWKADPKFWGRTSPVLFPFVGAVKEKQFRTKRLFFHEWTLLTSLFCIIRKFLTVRTHLPFLSFFFRMFFSAIQPDHLFHDMLFLLSFLFYFIHHIIPLLHLPVILLSLLKFSLEGRSITGGIPKPLRYRFFRLVHSSCR